MIYRNLAPQPLGLAGCRDHELIELALTYRFAGIDLNLERFQEQVRSKGMQQAKRYWTSAPLRITSAPLPLSLEREDVDSNSVESTVRETVDSVRELNCHLLTMTLTAGHDALSYQQNFERHCRLLEEIANVLSDTPVKLGLSFSALRSDRARYAHSFIQNVEALLALIHLVGAPNLVAIVDLWQWILGGGTLQDIERLGTERIGNVLLSDLPPDYSADTITSTQRLLPSADGVIDSVAVLSLLAKMAYAGPITPTPHPQQLQAQSREACVERVAARMDELMQLVTDVSITGRT